MNIISLENKFKDIETKEKKLKTFFNPFIKEGPKHYCIKDVLKDFEYDTLLYGLGKFYKQVIDLPYNNTQNPSLAKNNEITEKNSEKNKKNNKYQKIIQKKLSVENSEPLPMLTNRISKFSKLKDVSLIDKTKSITKEEYFGSFANTKLPLKTVFMRKNNNSQSPDWKTSGNCGRVSNKSALDHIKDGFDSNKTSEINLFRRFSREKVQISPKNYSPEQFYQEKPLKKFELTEKPIFSKEKEEKHTTPKWFSIKSSKSPILDCENNSTITITLINPQKSYPKLTFKGKPGKSYDLSDIPWLSDWKNQIIRISKDCESFSDYYLYYGELTEKIHQNLEKTIDEYLDFICPIHKKGSVSPVMPLTLKKISEKSPLRSKSSIKLPALNEKIVETKDFPNYVNPVTRGLVSYRENVASYNPLSFPANLAIFEMHERMEIRYPVKSKAKEENFDNVLKFKVEGKKFK